MKSALSRILLLFCVAACAVSCASDPIPKKKKKKRPPLPGEDASDLSWNRPVRANDVGSPLGMPMSR
jgi:hypothetical protein